MGKNQQHKSMQMAKHSSRSGGGEAGAQDARYHGHDASFHTAEWHAARLAALQMERPRWGAGIWRPPPPAAAAGRPTERAAPQQCIQGQRFGCVVLCSWDDWKKTQDEAAAREAAMEAAVVAAWES